MANRGYSDISGELDDCIATYANTGVFSGAVLVAQAGQVLLSKGYGHADFDHYVPNAPTTRFRVDSLVAPFVEGALAQLEGNGELRLTTIPESQRPVGLEERAKLVAHVAGSPALAFLRTRLFEPMGMLDTVEDDPSAVIRHRATGYLLTSRGMRRAHHGIAGEARAGSLALLSTVEDLYAWERARRRGTVVESGAGKSSPAETYAREPAAAVPSHAEPPIDGPSVAGFPSLRVHFPELDATLIVLANLSPTPLPRMRAQIHGILTSHALSRTKAASTETRKAAAGAAETRLWEHEEAVVDAGLLARCQGHFELPGGQVLFLTFDGHALTAQFTGHGRSRLHPAAPDLFFYKGVGLTLRMLGGGAAGAPDRVLLEPDGITATRLPR